MSGSQVEVKRRLKHLSYTEQLYIAIQTNAIASVQTLLKNRSKTSVNEKCFYTDSYYRVPQTDEFAAINYNPTDNDDDDDDDSDESNSKSNGSASHQNEDEDRLRRNSKYRFDDIEKFELAFVSWSSSRKCCTRCWSVTGVVAIFGPLLALTFTISTDERFLMDSAAQTISLVWLFIVLICVHMLWLIKESLMLHDGDVTPLQLAVLFGRHELVKILCQEPYCGDPNIKNASGYDCFTLAKRYVPLVFLSFCLSVFLFF
jgi:hypothetical protein